MKTSEKLRPCPAGHHGAKLSYDDEFEAWIIKCGNPSCTWRLWDDTAGSAAERWNYRHD